MILGSWFLSTLKGCFFTARAKHLLRPHSIKLCLNFSFCKHIFLSYMTARKVNMDLFCSERHVFGWLQLFLDPWVANALLLRQWDDNWSNGYLLSSLLLLATEVLSYRWCTWTDHSWVDWFYYRKVIRLLWWNFVSRRRSSFVMFRQFLCLLICQTSNQH